MSSNHQDNVTAESWDYTDYPEWWNYIDSPSWQTIDTLLREYLDAKATSTHLGNKKMIEKDDQFFLHIISEMFENGVLKIHLPEYDSLVKAIDKIDIQLMDLLCEGVPQKGLAKAVQEKHDVYLEFETIKKRLVKWRKLTGCKSTKDAINKFIEIKILNQYPLQ